MVPVISKTGKRMNKGIHDHLMNFLLSNGAILFLFLPGRCSNVKDIRWMLRTFHKR